MSKYAVLITKNHPLYDLINEKHKYCYDPENGPLFEGKKGRYQDFDYIFDFVVAEEKNKLKLLKALSIEVNCPIISDMSLDWGDYLLKNFSKISGALSTVFHSPTNTFEYFAKDESTNSVILDLFKKLDTKGLRVDSPGICFNFPRVISQIINEAYFALEDNLASEEEIDLAMINGVNYPLGPIEWSKKIGLNNVYKVLKRLYYVTEDKRYRPSSYLKMLALKD